MGRLNNKMKQIMKCVMVIGLLTMVSFKNKSPSTPEETAVGGFVVTPVADATDTFIIKLAGITDNTYTYKLYYDEGTDSSTMPNRGTGTAQDISTNNATLTTTTHGVLNLTGDAVYKSGTQTNLAGSTGLTISGFTTAVEYTFKLTRTLTTALHSATLIESPMSDAVTATIAMTAVVAPTFRAIASSTVSKTTDASSGDISNAIEITFTGVAGAASYEIYYTDDGSAPTIDESKKVTAYNDGSITAGTPEVKAVITVNTAEQHVIIAGLTADKAYKFGIVAVKGTAKSTIAVTAGAHHTSPAAMTINSGNNALTVTPQS